jgi:hypothetical protein
MIKEDGSLRPEKDIDLDGDAIPDDVKPKPKRGLMAKIRSLLSKKNKNLK